jgi:hypothetical protein
MPNPSANRESERPVTLADGRPLIAPLDLPPFLRERAGAPAAPESSRPTSALERRRQRQAASGGTPTRVELPAPVRPPPPEAAPIAPAAEETALERRRRRLTGQGETLRPVSGDRRPERSRRRAARPTPVAEPLAQPDLTGPEYAETLERPAEEISPPSEAEQAIRSARDFAATDLGRAGLTGNSFEAHRAAAVLPPTERERAVRDAIYQQIADILTLTHDEQRAMLENGFYTGAVTALAALLETEPDGSLFTQAAAELMNIWGLMVASNAPPEKIEATAKGMPEAQRGQTRWATRTCLEALAIVPPNLPVAVRQFIDDVVLQTNNALDATEPKGKKARAPARHQPTAPPQGAEPRSREEWFRQRDEGQPTQTVIWNAINIMLAHIGDGREQRLQRGRIARALARLGGPRHQNRPAAPMAPQTPFPESRPEPLPVTRAPAETVPAPRPELLSPEEIQAANNYAEIIAGPEYLNLQATNGTFVARPDFPPEEAIASIRQLWELARDRHQQHAPAVFQTAMRHLAEVAIANIPDRATAERQVAQLRRLFPPELPPDIAANTLRGMLEVASIRTPQPLL